MGRPKPKEWQPKGLELFLIGNLFSDSALEEMLSVIGGRARAHADEAKARILDVAGWLNAELYYSGRPNSAEKRAAITPVAAALVELQEHLSKLDADSVSLLERTAGQTPYDPQAEPTRLASMEQYPSALGHARYQSALEALRLLAGWTEMALEDVATERRGRPSLNTARQAAYRLLEIWKDYAREPTLTPFLKVLRLVALPVYANYKQAPNFERAAKDILYGSRKPDQPEGQNSPHSNTN
jgi:hypothetical protein